MTIFSALPSFLAHGDARDQLEMELDGGPPLWPLSPTASGVPKELRETQSAVFTALRSMEDAFAD